MENLEKVLQRLRIVVKNQEVQLDEIVEDFGKEEGADQVRGEEKLQGHEYKPPCGANDTTLSFIFDVFSNH